MWVRVGREGECDPGVDHGESDKIRIQLEGMDPLIKGVPRAATMDFPIELNSVR